MSVPDLRKKETATVADFRIIHPELMAVIFQSKWLDQIIRERLEAPKMPDPTGVVIISQPNSRCPAVVAKPQASLREIRRADRISNFPAKTGDLRIGTVGGWGWFENHPSHLRGTSGKGKYGGSPHPPFV
jgi:hypothetical protein